MNEARVETYRGEHAVKGRAIGNETMRDSQVQNAVQTLKDRRATLRERIEELAGRLGPVLAPPPPPSEKLVSAQGSDCAIEAQLLMTCDDLSMDIAFLEILTKRLCV